MTFKLGYTEFAYGPGAGSIRHVGGGQTAFNMDIHPGSVAEALVMSQQLFGYRESTDPVAIVWDDDPTWDGLYTVTAVTVDPVGVYLAAGLLHASITVVKYVNPVIETDYTLTYRTVGSPTDYYIAAGNGYSDASTDVHDQWASDNGGFGMSGSGYSIVSPGGEIGTIDVGADTAAALTEVQVQTGPMPSRFNLGAAVIEAWSDGVGWWVVPGRTLPSKTDVRVSNGRIRITPVVGTRFLLVDCWTGSKWGQGGRLYMSWAGNDLGVFAARWQVIRNTRAQVVLRCPVVGAFSGFRAAHVDIVVTRGLESATAVMSTSAENVAATADVTMTEYDGSGMATTLWSTHGLYRSSANADGVSLAITADAGTPAIGTDDIAFASGTSNRFGVGPDSTTKVLDEYRTNYQITDTVI